MASVASGRGSVDLRQRLGLGYGRQGRGCIGISGRGCIEAVLLLNIVD